MPYTNIHWIKLEKRLLNDPRFFLMSETAQLYYIKLLLLCAECGNKVNLKWTILGQLLRSHLTESGWEEVFKEIRDNFPKVLVNNGFCHIKDFAQRINQISKGYPADIQGIAQIKNKNKIKKEDIDKTIGALISIKGWNVEIEGNPLLLTDTYKRHGSAARNLCLLLGSADLAVEAIKWLNKDYRERGLSWTLETVVRHIPDFLKYHNQPESVKEFMKQTITEQMIRDKLGKIATKDMIKNFLKNIPQKEWGKVSMFLRKQYPEDGVKSFAKAETEVLGEGRNEVITKAFSII